MKKIFLILIALGLVISASILRGQEPTGGGSLLHDITGGAALIFRAPKDPIVHVAAVVAGSLGGGKTKARKQTKPPVRQQDNIIARANAARSAPKPRYAEAEEQYRLAAKIAPDDARAFAGLGNIFVDQGKFTDAVDSYKQALKVKPDYSAALLPLTVILLSMRVPPAAHSPPPYCVLA